MKRRYTTRGWSPDAPESMPYWADGPRVTTITVMAKESAPRDTGLLDASGVPLYASDDYQIGFLAEDL